MLYGEGVKKDFQHYKCSSTEYVKVAVNPKTTNFYNGKARANFFLYSILSII